MGFLNSLVNGIGLGLNSSDDASSIASTALMVAGAGSGNPALMMAGAQMANQNSALAAIEAQKDANSQNIRFQRETNDKSIELANTAHQREMRDLAAAGLNPILSAKYGGSATPAIGSPVMQSLSGVIQNSAKQSADITTSNAEMRQQAMLQGSQIALNSAQAVKTTHEAQRVAMENDVLLDQTKKRQYEEARRVNRPRWQKNLGIDVQDSVGSVLGPVFKLFK